MGDKNTEPNLFEAIEWKQKLWLPPVKDSLDGLKQSNTAGKLLLEMGYNSGKMSCYLSNTYDLKIEAYDLNPVAKTNADELKKKLFLDDKINFHTSTQGQKPGEKSKYDFIFIKSFLYHTKSRSEYEAWIQHFHDCLKEGGYLIGIENCRGNFLTRAWRFFLKKINWSDHYLHTKECETIINKHFKSAEFRYYWRYSQFFTFFPLIFNWIARFESKQKITANDAFITGIIAQK